MKLMTPFKIGMLVWTALLPISQLSAEDGKIPGPEQPVVLENAHLRIEIHRADANFTLTHKDSGKVWHPDPWVDRAAGFVEFRKGAADTERINLSKSNSIRFESTDAVGTDLVFENFVTGAGKVIPGYVKFRFWLSSGKPDLAITLVDYATDGGQITRLEYPARHFHLRWETERGLAVIPYLQGVVIPSYRFPRPNSKFGFFDDYQGSIGEMGLYGWEGLSMPWFGVHDDRCAVVTTLPDNQAVSLQYLINSNNSQYWHTQRRTEVQDPRILALTPVWSTSPAAKNQTLHYHFITRGTHVEMAKYYREIARRKGLFVSLAEKAKRQPAIEQMRGAIYFHLYGGYPHYVNYAEMAFSFDELAATLRDIHDHKGLKNAIINVWGAYENYPPTHLPYNLRAGGEAKLKAAYDLAKSYGYLITNYHSWHATLEHDPLYDPAWIQRDASGQRQFGGKWGGSMDKRLWLTHARHLMEREIPALAPNLFYSDGSQAAEVAGYTASFNLPVTIERTGKSELFVREYACIEGIGPYNQKSPTWCPLEAPLFNLVYHDAIFTTNRWQSPDNDYDMNGDFPTRELRNMLAGNLPVFVVPLWEYPGISDMIAMVNQTAAPWNREIAFAELTDHAFLSQDMNVQRSRFSNDAEVTVNFALCDHALPDGQIIPGYGFVMKFANGGVRKGRFQTSVIIE